MTLPDEPECSDDRQLARYLLGLLPDDDVERLDEASIVDDEIAARLRIVENDLVDAYVRGTLSGELLERFESRYLASPRRRHKTKFAEKFLRAVDRTAPADSDRDGSAPRGPASGESRDASANAGASRSQSASRVKMVLNLLAVAAVMLIACGTLLLQTFRLRDGLDLAHKESVALDRRAHELEQALDAERAANALVTRELERVKESVAAIASQSVQKAAAALILMPQTRSIGAIPALAIPPAAERVAFELRLESNDFAKYDVALKDPGTNRVVWQSGPLSATSSGGTTAVSVTVPVRFLRPQHYSFALTGVGTSGRSVVGSYTFEVARR